MTDVVKPDTSEAAVERAAEMLEAYDFDVTADLLRALLAERDALRAQLTEAKEALQPFAFLARVNARLNLDPELPLKDFVPGVWPKWKDVQRALAALREAGHE